MQLCQGWPPWVRLESKDKKTVFGVETNDEVTKSNFMPEALLKKLYANRYVIGTFCVTQTGDRTQVPYDNRVIKYVRVISYRIEEKK